MVLGMFLFLGSGALVTDLGYAHSQRQRAQGISDATVLSVMSELNPDEGGRGADARVRAIFAANGVPEDTPIEVTYEATDSGAVLRVEARIRNPAFLAGALGFGDFDTAVVSEAVGDDPRLRVRGEGPRGGGHDPGEDELAPTEPPSSLTRCDGCPGEPPACQALREELERSSPERRRELLAKVLEMTAPGRQGPRTRYIEGSRDWSYSVGGDTRFARALDEIADRLTDPPECEAPPPPGADDDPGTEDEPRLAGVRLNG